MSGRKSSSNPALGNMTAIISICCLMLLNVPQAISASSRKNDCELPASWSGRWFHLGFPEPLSISRKHITGKGSCVYRNKNMFLMRDESDPSLGECYRCMVIYEKHFNVLQYKESYCEEMDNIESMESLCNTIAGDAPLYSMFRKEGSLVKCPFRGPFSFSYSKGDSGQVCSYPMSYMDTCSDNKRLQLRYQACHDVQGSEIKSEEMSCLATWKEGSRRYLVSMMNHSHVYNDEARYRCFVYQKQRGDNRKPGKNREVQYKMAMSSFASCLGLWDVNEGYKTFNLKKLNNDNSQCKFPEFFGHHHDWHSVDQSHLVIHLNKRGHSFKMRNQSISSFEEPAFESTATCHQVEQKTKHMSKIVAHVKAGCDSGFVCLVFYYRDKHVIQMRYGEKSRDPSEACMNYHFDKNTSPITTLVQNGGHNRKPCPFSGRYTIDGNIEALSKFIDPGNTLQSDEKCEPALSTVMRAGCSQHSSDLNVKTTCKGRAVREAKRLGERRASANDLVEIDLNNEYVCHGSWQEVTQGQQNHLMRGEKSSQPVIDDSYSSGRRGGWKNENQRRQTRQHRQQGRQRTEVLILSSKAVTGSERPKFLCLTYTELQDGVLSAYAGSEACNRISTEGYGEKSRPVEQYEGRFSTTLPLLSDSLSLSLSSSKLPPLPHGKTFNISSSGPCLQALTSRATTSFSKATMVMTLGIFFVLGRH